MNTHYQYELHVDVPATDLRILYDALDDQALSLTEKLGQAELHNQLDNFFISVDLATDERWNDFETDIAILSAYLAAPISGTEVAVEADQLRAWRLIGRAGDVVRIELEVTKADDGSVQILGEDTERLADQMPSMPRWAQSLLSTRLGAQAVR